MSQLDGIHELFGNIAFPETPEERDDAERKILALVREQAAKLEAVAALAEAWRYKGEFGWGAWQEGHGPDPEGYVLDTCAGEIRAALEATK